MPCKRQVAIRLCTMPVCLAPTSVQQKSQFLRPVGIAHRNRAQGALDVVGVDGHLGVVEKNAQPRPTLAHVGQRLGQRIARQQAQLLELLVDPVEELVDQRLAVHQPVNSLGLSVELALSDLLLDLVQRRDLLECLACGLRLGIFGFEDAAP